MQTKVLLEEWLEQQTEQRVKWRTYQRYRSLIDVHIVPALGGLNVQALDRKTIQTFLLEQKQRGNARSGGQLSSASVNMIHGVLGMAFEYACEMGYMEENPCIRIRRARMEVKKIEAFTLEEQRGLEAEIERSTDRRLHGVLICLYTGIRIGELLGLAWDDVDLSEGLIRINKTVYQTKDRQGKTHLCVDVPKTDSSNRVIPLPDYITELLMRDKAVATTPYVIENKKGKRMAVRSYQNLFARLTERAKVRRLNFHALRHTFATRAIEFGVDVKTVADIMGHRNASMTLNRYAHCMLDHKKQMMQKLPRVLREGK